jgi:hypothetical protein
MKSKFRVLFTLFATALLILLLFAPPTVGGEKTEGGEKEGGTVSGQVYVAETEKPVRTAGVVIHRIRDSPQDTTEAERSTFMTVTNGEGYYEFVNIPSGRYFLVVVYGFEVDGGYSRPSMPEVCYCVIPVVPVTASAWVDITTAGIYYTDFEVEDGGSIVVDAPIEPGHFDNNFQRPTLPTTFGPIAIDLPSP